VDFHGSVNRPVRGLGAAYAALLGLGKLIIYAGHVLGTFESYRAELGKVWTFVVRSGSTAPTCGKPPAFRPMGYPSFSSAQAGRLSLPACAVG